jgi:hypothetical protein
MISCKEKINSLLTKDKHVASVQAQTFCCLNSLSDKYFYPLLEQYPIMRQTIESVAIERLRKLGHQDPTLISKD